MVAVSLNIYLYLHCPLPNGNVFRHFPTKSNKKLLTNETEQSSNKQACIHPVVDPWKGDFSKTSFLWNR